MRIAQLGINSVSTQHNGMEEALEAYQAAGFTNVEFVLPLVKEWLGAGRGVEDVKKLLAAHRLRCIGGFQAHVECFGAPESTRANHELQLQNAQLIHQLGGGTLVVGTDGPPSPSFADLDRVADTLRMLAHGVEGLDVNLALEFNWSPLVKSLKSAAVVCEKANHPQVGILFDPAHYHTTVSKMEDLDAATVRWIKHVHLDDMADKPGELSNCNSDRVLPGQGILDLPVLISRLEEHGYQGFYSIEMFNEELWKLTAGEAARRCFESLQPLCSG